MPGHDVVDPASVGMSAERLERIAPAMQGYVDRGVVRGISTLVARRGQVVNRGLYGHRDAETAAEMTSDTIFRIYSMTKPIVSTGLMLLYEEGRFLLDQPVSDFLPAFAAPKVMKADGSVVDAAAPITIGDLLGHTSGLTYDFMVDNPAAQLYRDHRVMHDATRTLEECVDLIASLPLAFQPGERFHYSVGIDVAARLIEVIADQALGDFLSERVFGPIGMTSTAFGVPDHQLNRLAAMYGLPDLVGENYDANNLVNAALAGSNERIDVSTTYPTSTPDVFVRGGLGLFSTIDDYFRFAQTLANGGELDGTRLWRTGRRSRNDLPLFQERLHLARALLFDRDGQVAVRSDEVGVVTAEAGSASPCTPGELVQRQSATQCQLAELFVDVPVDVQLPVQLVQRVQVVLPDLHLDPGESVPPSDSSGSSGAERTGPIADCEL